MVNRTPFIFIIAVMFMLFCHSVHAADKVEKIAPVVVNASGNTIGSLAPSGTPRILHNSIGESIISQTWGASYSMQGGFFNEYFLLAPSATVTPTITVTQTPIRAFNGELLSEQWVYAAPNPIRGHQANLVYHLAESADVDLKIFTTGNQ